MPRRRLPKRVEAALDHLDSLGNNYLEKMRPGGVWRDDAWAISLANLDRSVPYLKEASVLWMAYYDIYLDVAVTYVTDTQDRTLAIILSNKVREQTGPFLQYWQTVAATLAADELRCEMPIEISQLKRTSEIDTLLDVVTTGLYALMATLEENFPGLLNESIEEMPKKSITRH